MASRSIFDFGPFFGLTVANPNTTRD